MVIEEIILQEKPQAASNLSHTKANYLPILEYTCSVGALLPKQTSIAMYFYLEMIQQCTARFMHRRAVLRICMLNKLEWQTLQRRNLL